MTWAPEALNYYSGDAVGCRHAEFDSGVVHIRAYRDSILLYPLPKAWLAKWFALPSRCMEPTCISFFFSEKMMSRPRIPDETLCLMHSFSRTLTKQ